MTTFAVSPEYLLFGCACVTGVVACVTDARSRRIPNALTLSSAALAVAVRLATAGPAGAFAGVVGMVVGLLLFMPLFVVRGLGGGDVKLLAAFGAWVGVPLVLWVALYTALAGGVLALTLALWHGVLRRTVANVSLLIAHWRVAGISSVSGLTLEDARSIRLAYAFPLMFGLLGAIWLKG